jgi:hypothetical protein
VIYLNLKKRRDSHLRLETKYTDLNKNKSQQTRILRLNKHIKDFDILNPKNTLKIKLTQRSGIKDMVETKGLVLTNFGGAIKDFRHS